MISTRASARLLIDKDQKPRWQPPSLAEVDERDGREPISRRSATGELRFDLAEREELGMATIGFIGLGNMGAPMAANLLKARHQVTGYDIVAGRGRALRRSAGRRGGERRRGGRSAGDIVDHHAAGRAAGARGLSRQWRHLAAAPRKGALLIDCSTIDVETARAVATAAAKAGFDMLDAPVSGGVGGAAAAR